MNHSETESEEKEKMPNWWSFFEDNAGGFSTIRAVLTLWILVVCILWSITCIRKKELVDIPTNVVTLTIGLATVKGVQRFGEKTEG